MTSITVRNLDESIKAGLRLRAARHGWSMEQEVRLILRQALSEDADAPDTLGFAEMVNRRFRALGVDDLPTPKRQSPRPLPDFGHQ